MSVSWRNLRGSSAVLILALAICAGFGTPAALGSATRPLHRIGPVIIPPGQYQSDLAAAVHADVTASVPLPSGSDLWVFGDTSQVNGNNMVGGFAHDSMATESAASFTMVPGHYGFKDTAGHQWQQVPNFSSTQFFWAEGIFRTGNTVWVPGVRADTSGTVASTEMAKFNATTLAYVGVTQLPGTEIWGSSIATSTGHWLVGTRKQSSTACTSFATDCFAGDVAWVPNGDETDEAKWTITTDAFPASLNAGAIISPVAVSGGYRAYTKQGDQFGGTQIEELSAPHMTGPWSLTGRTWPTTYPSGATTYDVQVHPEEYQGSDLLVSYAVNDYPSGQYDPNFFDLAP
jgi:hypothetical protein